MKYIKYTICIMIVVSILSFCKTNAIGIGQLTINFVGNVETGAQKKRQKIRNMREKHHAMVH